MVLVASITNKKKRKENPKKERKEERENVGSLIMCVAGLERIALGGFTLCKWIAHGPLDCQVERPFTIY